MNDILQLKGSFEQAGNHSGFSKPKIPNKYTYDVGKIRNIREKLSSLHDYWLNNQNYISGAIVEVRYSEIVAKSNRIKKLFSVNTSNTDDLSIVGARFSDDSGKHIITYYFDFDSLSTALKALAEIEDIIEYKYDGVVNNDTLDAINRDSSIGFSSFLTKSKATQILVDLCRIEDICVPKNTITNIHDENNLVLFFNVGIDIVTIANKIGINNPKKLDNNTLVLDDYSTDLLMREAPYLVAMSVSDIMNIGDSIASDEDAHADEIDSIKDPSNEPIIGVIDTLFDERVYFNKWVDYINKVDPNIPTSQDDKRHGTEVTSIIVDGPRFNPGLDDGCGNFRVRHFAVGGHNRINVFTISKLIQEIVEENKDIHVWNLSLGDDNEINENYISPIAALLDDIQYKNDVIFIVSGTNNRGLGNKKIGSPADSINSIVVNSVKRDGSPASYTRNGQVLSFFNKPDICYYGGDDGELLTSCDGTGTVGVMGTSFAAPWISRKMCYLIDVIGLDREVAKALLIDSATSWDKQIITSKSLQEKGFGVVPIKISEIVQTPKDEIRFTMSGISKKYDTYSYNIPVPIADDRFPYISRATMCYFPKCNRNQGVDYTGTEMDVYFGRVDSHGKIKSINDNKQCVDFDDFPSYICEKTARKLYRKWDNTKHICEYIKQRRVPKTKFDSPYWGVSIKTKERLSDNSGENLRFGLVVTLKELYGVNRIEDFVRQCILRGWIVNRINIDNKVEVYNKLQEEISFDL